MIDANLLLTLELSILTVLVGAGIWRIYKALQSPMIDAPAPESHDMREDGQQLGLQTN